jgi:hypothetical protein
MPFLEFRPPPLPRQLKQRLRRLEQKRTSLTNPGLYYSHFIMSGNNGNSLDNRANFERMGKEFWDYYLSAPGKARALTNLVSEAKEIAAQAEIGGAVGAPIHPFMGASSTLQGFGFELPNIVPAAKAGQQREPQRRRSFRVALPRSRAAIRTSLSAAIAFTLILLAVVCFTLMIGYQSFPSDSAKVGKGRFSESHPNDLLRTVQ